MLPAPAAAGTLGDLARSVGSGETRAKGLFGKIEVAGGSLEALPKWRRVLDYMHLWGDLLNACAGNRASCNPAYLTTFHDAIEQARGLPPFEQLKLINAHFNRWPYKLDQDNYQVSDYWATPFEFIPRSGDCEDYSITKYYALRALGFPIDDLRIVILVDRIRGLAHAVLTVKLDNDEFVLDNQANVVMSHHRYRHYDPQYSVNETTRWVHIGGLE